MKFFKKEKIKYEKFSDIISLIFSVLINKNPNTDSNITINFNKNRKDFCLITVKNEALDILLTNKKNVLYVNFDKYNDSNKIFIKEFKKELKSYDLRVKYSYK